MYIYCAPLNFLTKGQTWDYTGTQRMNRDGEGGGVRNKPKHTVN